MTVYVGWPLLGGLMLSSVLALCVGGTRLLAGRGWMAAGQAAGWVFFVVLGAATVGVFLYAMLGWAGPRRIERMRQEVVVEERPDRLGENLSGQGEEPWRVLRGRPALAARSGEVMVEHQVASVEPTVRTEIREMYDLIVRAWPTGNVARDHCMGMGISRSSWQRLVGGARRKRGLESDRGLLDRAGVVRQERQGWAPCATLEEALRINEELWEYAREKASLVKL